MKPSGTSGRLFVGVEFEMGSWTIEDAADLPPGLKASEPITLPAEFPVEFTITWQFHDASTKRARKAARKGTP